MKISVRALLFLALLVAAIACLTLVSGAITVSTEEGFLDAVVAGKDIELADHITLSKGVTIDRDLKIEGNGHTLTFAAITKFSSSLVIKGTTAVVGYAFQINAANVTVANVTVVAPAKIATGGTMFYLADAMAALTLQNVVTEGSYIPLVFNAAASLTVTGADTHLGKNSGHQYTIAATSAATGASLILEGGKISHTQTDSSGDEAVRSGGDCIYLNCDAFSVKISGGSIMAANAIHMPSGVLDLQIEGGSIRSLVGDAVCVEDGTVVLQMSSGNVSSAGGDAFQLPETTQNRIAISGGMISATAESAYALKGVTGIVTISGTAALQGSVLLNGGSLTISDQASFSCATYSYGSGDTLGYALLCSSAEAQLTITGGVFQLGDTKGSILLLQAGTAPVSVTGGRWMVGEAGKVVDAAAGTTLQLSNVLIVDSNVVSDVVLDTKGTVTLSDCIILSKIYKTVGGNVSATISDSSPTVKYGGASYYMWMNRGADAWAPLLTAGAGVRAQLDSQGIRFTASVSADTVAALEAKGQVTYGILIAPVDYVAAAGDFTVKALEAYATAKGKEASTVYVNVVAKNSLHEEAGTLYFNAVLIGLKNGNYQRKFAAVAYALVDGTYYYSAFDSADNARSLSDVAVAALSDTKTADELAADTSLAVLYCQPIDGTELYSKYTEEQRNAFARYIAS